MNIQQSVPKNYDSFDVVKFISAIAIIAIHTQFCSAVLYPWLRLAVPLFFTISSYLFFSKVNCTVALEQRSVLILFVKRILLLYAVWFVLLLPYTLFVRREWFDDGVLWGILQMLRHFFFGSTFPLSWFLMANLIAVVIVFCCRKIHNGLLLLVSGGLNVFCCLVSGYQQLFPIIALIQHTIEPYIGSVMFNFIVALFWVSLGKSFAEGFIQVKLIMAVITSLILLVLLYVEFTVTRDVLHLQFDRDCFFMLIPCVVFLFALLLNTVDSFRCKYAMFLRRSSVLIYIIHCPILFVVRHLLAYFSVYSTTFNFIITTIGAIVSSWMIIKLSEKQKFSFLKRLY